MFYLIFRKYKDKNTRTILEYEKISKTRYKDQAIRDATTAWNKLSEHEKEYHRMLVVSLLLNNESDSIADSNIEHVFFHSDIE
jgi:hypothetical protein